MVQNNKFKYSAIGQDRDVIMDISSAGAAVKANITEIHNAAIMLYNGNRGHVGGVTFESFGAFIKALNAEIAQTLLDNRGNATQQNRKLDELYKAIASGRHGFMK